MQLPVDSHWVHVVAKRAGGLDLSWAIKSKGWNAECGRKEGQRAVIANKEQPLVT